MGRTFGRCDWSVLTPFKFTKARQAESEVTDFACQHLRERSRTDSLSKATRERQWMWMDNSCISTIDQHRRFYRKNGQFSSSFLGTFLLDTAWGQTGLCSRFSRWIGLIWIWLKNIDTPNRWFPTKYDHSFVSLGTLILSHCHIELAIWVSLSRPNSQGLGGAWKALHSWNMDERSYAQHSPSCCVGGNMFQISQDQHCNTRNV